MNGAPGRSLVVGERGVAATTHPRGALVALDVLRAGGNAVDAAVAMNAAMGFLEPTGCGIGGDLFALVWSAKDRRLYGLNASGRDGRNATIQAIRDRGHDFIPTQGPLSVSVPGCVDGWHTLLARFGTRPLGDLLEPAIELAQRGYPVPRTLSNGWKASEPKLAASSEGAETFLPGGRAPHEGEMFANPRLASSLRSIASGGRDAFYQGPLGREWIAYLRAQGGLLTEEDLEQHASTWVEPVSVRYREVDVWAIPPPGQGIAALQMLGILNGFDLSSCTESERWHLLIEAKKLAYADRARYYADPAFANVPTAELVSTRYAERRRALIDRGSAGDHPAPGDLDLSQADTVYMTVVDADRNAVSLIQSNYMGFGSGVMAGDLGFMLQNRGLAFSLDPDHPNCLQPGKRPFHTIIPGFATRDGAPWLCFGVMGGDMQPQGQVQVLVNRLDLGMDLQSAGEAPRIEHVGSPTPEGKRAEGSGRIVPEPEVAAEVVRELEAMGHTADPAQRNGGAFQGIEFGPHGTLLGASEARRDGQAVAY